MPATLRGFYAVFSASVFPYDVATWSYAIERFGYKREDIVVLTDDQRDPRSIPTKTNIVSRLPQWYGLYVEYLSLVKSYAMACDGCSAKWLFILPLYVSHVLSLYQQGINDPFRFRAWGSNKGLGWGRSRRLWRRCPLPHYADLVVNMGPVYQLSIPLISKRRDTSSMM